MDSLLERVIWGQRRQFDSPDRSLPNVYLCNSAGWPRRNKTKADVPHPAGAFTILVCRLNTNQFRHSLSNLQRLTVHHGVCDDYPRNILPPFCCV
jgi:hypothetical protein